MTVRIIAMLAPVLMTTACAAPQPQPVIVGGWSSVATTDAGVAEAAGFAATQLGSPLAAILAARMQVVAGTNYELDLRLADGRHVRAVVWRRLDGTLVLSDAR